MSGRNRIPTKPLAFFALAILLSAAPAFAQSPEKPKAEAVKVDAPKPDAPKPDTPPKSDSPKAEAPKPELKASKGEISASVISQQSDPWGVGWLGKADGALPNTVWAATDAATLAELMSALQPSSLSPTARAALRRVVLSSARGPKDGADLIPERLRLIELVGETEKSIDLRRRFAQTDWGKKGDLVASQYELAAGRSGSACARVAEKPPEDPVWLSTRALCFAIAGDGNAAGAAAERVQTPDGQPDTWLIAAIETMGANAKAKPAGRYGASLEAAVSITAKLSAPFDAFKATPADIALFVMRHPNATAEQKRAAMRVAVDAGKAQAGDVLAVLNAAPDPPPSGKAAPKPKPDFLMLALAASADKSLADDARSTAYAVAFKGAETATDFRIAAIALHDSLKPLAKSDATFPNAEVFARAALVAGDTPLAIEWRKLLDHPPKEVDRADAWAKAHVDLMLSFAGAPGEKPADILDRLIEAVGPPPETASKAQTPAMREAELRRIENTRALFLYVGMGRALNPSARTLLASQRTAGRGVSDAALARVQSALDANADGEAALAAIGQISSDASALSFAGLSDLLRALRGAGLERDASAIALESLQPWKAL